MPPAPLAPPSEPDAAALRAVGCRRRGACTLQASAGADSVHGGAAAFSQRPVRRLSEPPGAPPAALQPPTSPAPWSKPEGSGCLQGAAVADPRLAVSAGALGGRRAAVPGGSAACNAHCSATRVPAATSRTWRRMWRRLWRARAATWSTWPSTARCERWVSSVAWRSLRSVHDTQSICACLMHRALSLSRLPIPLAAAIQAQQPCDLRIASRLTSLSLRTNFTTDDAFLELFESLTGLRSLDISCEPRLGRRGSAMLRSSSGRRASDSDMPFCSLPPCPNRSKPQPDGRRLSRHHPTGGQPHAAGARGGPPSERGRRHRAGLPHPTPGPAAGLQVRAEGQRMQ